MTTLSCLIHIIGAVGWIPSAKAEQQAIARRKAAEKWLNRNGIIRLIRNGENGTLF